MRLSSNIWWKHSKLYEEFNKNCEEDIYVVAEHMVNEHSDRYYITKAAQRLIDRINVGKADYSIFGKIGNINIAIAIADLDYGIVHCRIQDGILSTLMMRINSDYHLSYDLVRVNSESGEWRHAIGVVDNWNEEQEAKFRDKIMKVLIYLFLSDVIVQMIPIGRSNGQPKKQGKIINDSSQPVKVVTSKWNTLTVRTGGFEVGGHFRLQPFGIDRKEVRLVYIKPYKKKGYTRRN